MKKNLITFLKAIAAGIMIGIGGTAYLSIDNKIIGSFLFTTGLIMIIHYQLGLYTGKVGYIFDNKISFLADCLIIWIGNFLGTFLLGHMMGITRYGTQLKAAAEEISSQKLADSIPSMLILAALCGVMIYLAVDCYNRVQAPLGRYISVFLCIMVFILSGFEHSIANMFYFTLAEVWSTDALLCTLIVTLGNALGSVLTAFIFKAGENQKTEQQQ